MSTSDHCPKCGKIIAYTSEATELQCPCGYRFLVVEFVSERLKIEKALEAGQKAQEALAATKAEKAALQNRLNDTLTALDGILGSQRAEDAKLEGILDSLKADRQTHDAMTALLQTLRRDQQSGQDALSRLLGEVMKGQSGAAEKLTAVQELAARVLNAQKSGAKAVEQMQDEILERIETFDLKARERLSLSNDFYEWSRSMQQADVQRLETLQASSDTLLQGQKEMTAKLNGLSDDIARANAAISEGFDELRKHRLDKLIEMYHQATGLQIEREFEKAEDTYRNLLAEGGQDAQYAEVYWRMLLCHYGVEYQEDKGKTIPIILRPDLTDPSTMQVRKDLFAHTQSDEQRAYYTERLKKIDSYLDRYRQLRMDKKWKFDIFISVKQKDDDRYTSDSDRASELYFYFKGKPELAAKKLRVFNSRHISLPKGKDYEPYIITAVMSAKLLIVVGSKKDYMDSPWVRNEWMRFQYLQEQERDKTGKTERRLFCYFVGGMRPEKLPTGLNPDVQGVMGSVTAGDEILDVVEELFPGPAPLPTPQPVPPTPQPGETPEKIVGRMKTWLKLGYYQKVIDQYESLVDTIPEMLINTPWICLYTLCAKNSFRKIESLILARGDLRNDELYEFAYENADESLRAKLDALWAEKGAVSPIKPIPEAGQEASQELVYADGKYVGQVVNRKRHGMGVMYYNNGEKYDGEWKNDKRNGQGVLYFGDRDQYNREKCDGEWKNDTFSGKGVMTWKNGGKYDGQWNDGSRSGQGVHYYTNGDRYEGEWRNDKRNGQGVLYYGDRDQYNREKCDGEWRNNTFSGKGILTWKDGSRYDGQWNNGKFNGKGVMYYNNGEKYDGEWKDSLRSGQGVHSYLDGDRYEGVWGNDKRNGQGILYYGDRDQYNRKRYDGEWKNDKRNGKGIMTWKDGSRYDGQWKNGKFNGKGVYYKANGDRREGEWVDNELVTATPASSGATPFLPVAKRNPRLMGITTISARLHRTVGLKEDGTVVAVGNNNLGQGNVSGWEHIVAVSAGGDHTVGLKEDGTVIAVGGNGFDECNVSDWKNIIAVSTGAHSTVGLKEDGTVVAKLGKKTDERTVSEWKNIVAISSGDYHTIGVKEDGTVVAVGDNQCGQCNVSGWKNIIAVSAGYEHTVGLKEDGTVVAVGDNQYGQCNVSDWKNIVATSSGCFYTVGLKEDGTVVAVGSTWYGKCDVSDWKNIVAISAGSDHTVGLKEDGTVVAVGQNSMGECDISDWTDIRMPLWAKNAKTPTPQPAPEPPAPLPEDAVALLRLIISKKYLSALTDYVRQNGNTTLTDAQIREFISLHSLQQFGIKESDVRKELQDVYAKLGTKNPPVPAPNHYEKYIEALTNYVRRNGNITLTDAQIREFIGLHRLKQWDITESDVKTDLQDVYVKLGTKKPSVPAPNHYEKYIEALTNYVRQNGNITLTDAQIREFIGLHRLKQWDITESDVKTDLQDVYVKLGTRSQPVLDTFEKYLSALTDYVRLNGNTTLTDAQIRAFIFLHHLQRWNIKESDVKTDLQDVYVKLGIKSSSSYGKMTLTTQSALQFWCKHLPLVNSGALLPPNLTEKQILAAQKVLGTEMQGREDVLGVIHVKHGLFKGNTVVIVTCEHLYINTNNETDSPPQAVQLRKVVKAEAVQISDRKYQLNIHMKSGKALSFCSPGPKDSDPLTPERDNHDVLNYRALAQVINQFVQLFKL